MIPVHIIRWPIRGQSTAQQSVEYKPVTEIYQFKTFRSFLAKDAVPHLNGPKSIRATTRQTENSSRVRQEAEIDCEERMPSTDLDSKSSKQGM